MAGSFLDTNVLVYLASADTAKAQRAEAIVGAGGTISVQVLNEIANVARRKMRLAWPELHDFLAAIRALTKIVPLTVDIHDKGLELAERHGFSTHDAMIIAAALDADCDILWSEDMHHGMVIEQKLRITDPFRPAP